MDNDINEIGVGSDFFYGYCDFENYWGEELVEVQLVHYVSGFIDTNKYLMTSKRLENVANNTSLKKAFTVTYQKNNIDRYDFWEVVIRTLTGKIYRTKDRFRCSIAFYDSENIILGVNGDAQTLYVAFSSSSGCSTKLIEVM